MSCNAPTFLLLGASRAAFPFWDKPPTATKPSGRRSGARTAPSARGRMCPPGPFPRPGFASAPRHFSPSLPHRPRGSLTPRLQWSPPHNKKHAPTRDHDHHRPHRRPEAPPAAGARVKHVPVKHHTGKGQARGAERRTSSFLTVYEKPSRSGPGEAPSQQSGPHRAVTHRRREPSSSAPSPPPSATKERRSRSRADAASGPNGRDAHAFHAGLRRSVRKDGLVRPLPASRAQRSAAQEPLCSFKGPRNPCDRFS